jgi:protein phosphatase
MSWLRYGLVVGVALLVLIAGSVALYRASQSQYFVGVSNDHVAIYRGVEADLPFISLNSVVHETDIPISKLTRVNRDLVLEGIEAGDRAEADATVARLRATQPKPKPAPTPAPTPTETPSATPTTVDPGTSTA